MTAGLNTGCSSGLIDRETWDVYPFTVINLARKVKSQDPVGEQISVSFRNGGKRTVDYLVFVEHMSTVTVDKSTGMYLQRHEF